MLKHVLLLLTSVSTMQGRLVGASTAPEGAVPWQVSLRRSSGYYTHFCGAAIISERWLLTAAHCVTPTTAPGIIAVVGTNSLETGGTSHRIEKLVVHVDYNKPQYANDIALLKTAENIEYNDKVQAIKLPNRESNGGESCLLAGWGYVDEKDNRDLEKLQWLNVTALSDSGCAEALSRLGRFDLLTEGQICTANMPGQPSCIRDSGGALVERTEIIGAVSTHFSCSRTVPDVDVRVIKYLEWIEESMDASPDP